ncbi:FAD-dependent oxidoreductase [Spirosoma aerophilum]
MMLQNKHVAIVGGGPGGLTLARLLQLKGIQVNVYERDIDQHARVQGSPLDLHDDSGLAALRKANLLEEFKKNFLPGADKLVITNEHAEVLFSDHETKIPENFGHEHFRPEIDRGVLRNILFQSLQADTVIWDSHFMAMEKHNEGWLMHFHNGTSCYADIVIAADGANSKIRPYLTTIKPFYSGITMLEGTIYDAQRTAPQISALLRGGKVMAFGNRKDIMIGQKANGEIGFYISFKAEDQWASKSGLNLSDKTQLLRWFREEYFEWSSF